MDGLVPTVISVIALLATLYQLRLQRVHNERSLKPLPQIDLVDRGGLLYVRIQNNGVGPLILEKFTFQRGMASFARIEDCLDFDPKSYEHLEVSRNNKKVVIPGGFLEVFSKTVDESFSKELTGYRQQLSTLTLKVEGQDIYNNNVVIEKGLSWFNRHHQSLDSLS